MPENNTNTESEVLETETVEETTTQENTEQTQETQENTSEETQETVEMQFQPMEFVNHAKYMGMGMLGIFVVIGVIITITATLNKIFKK